MQLNKVALLTLMKGLGLFALARLLTRRSLRVLCYHGVWETPGFAYGDRAFISPEQFAARMAWLKASGYPVLPLDEAVDRMRAGTLPARAVAITIDDGWASTARHMAPILAATSMPATVYVTTWYVQAQLPIFNKALDYVLQASPQTEIDLSSLDIHGLSGFGLIRLGTPAERLRLALDLYAAMQKVPLDQRLTCLHAVAQAAGVALEPIMTSRQFHLMAPAEIADAHASGIAIELHTHRHIDINTQIDDLAAEVEENRAILRDIVPSAPLRHFCYPSGTYHPQADEILQRHGIVSATLIDFGMNPPGANPYRLRRFVDGRSVSPIEFEAYLAGVLDLIDPLLRRLRRA
jgi:peptidoglycan/xylan/chitin deacetylase (PgdA/CDA1 family)